VLPGVLRLHYQSNTSFASLPRYADALRKHARRVLGDAAEVSFHGLDERLYGGCHPGEVLRYPYLKHMVQDAALEACFQAARSGVDAFIVGSFSEPLLKASRSAVDLPVLSLPESAMLVACSLAERFALITLSGRQSLRVQEVVQRHGLGSRNAGCFDLGGRFTESDLEDALDRLDDVLAAFEAAGRRALDAGADVIVPAEGLLNEVVVAAGLQRLADAAVMDAVGVVLLHAQMMVRARHVLGLAVGREWSYPQARPELVDQLRRGTGRDAD